MLRVLLILLCVLLGVVVLLGVLLLALLCMRAGVELVGVSGEVTLDAIYGPLRIPLWPRPRHLKRKEKKKQAEPEKKPEEAPPKGKFSLAKSGLPFGKIADVALDFLGDLTGSLQITRLRVRLIIATGDAAKTGILFGQTAALCGILVPFLENTFDLRDIHVRADPDFDKENIKQYGCVVDNWTWQLEVWALSNGGRWFTEDGSACTINDPKVIESIQKVADLTLVENCMPYNAGLEDNGMQRSLLTGTVAMATAGAWNVGTCLATARDEGLNYGVARLPKMVNEVTICTGGPQVVFSQTKHPEEAMTFIKWYMKEENSWDSLIATGIWMPILEEYYTDETLTNKWIDNPNFPDHDEYKGAVVDYARDCAESTCWYYIPHTTEFIELLRTVLGPVWTGEQTAEQAITENYDALNAVFMGE